MAQHRFIGGLLSCFFVALTGYAETVTYNGVVFFDTSLGTLQRATVTVDPGIQNTSFIAMIGPLVPVDIHQHVVTFPSFQLLGRDFVFTPVSTSVNNAPTLAFHTHTFDLAPIVEMFEGDDLNNFLFNGTFILPGGVLLPDINTTESEGHFHHVHDSHLNFFTSAITTFDYTPAEVPEPATAVILACFAPVAMRVRRRRF
jgi:hypothetical protein